ncbi:MAG: T9SS type A sorting domain-containing protein [Flavobacterium sp.]|uniref:FG-GAP-like repeat-containing protein n=1 Tax=Flavobacterium sp. TaxID=239 RepID=UPI0012126DD7|nr:FG-GAP-like repeat-containing protein [Flavobacterium sp.]RZJ67806.1 MAG: T9SS type A sorting domain-containing protein [Flavobacterium sp.]
MKKFYLIALFSLPVLAVAQAVSFTATPLGGTTSYNPCTVDMNGDYLDDIVSVATNQLKVFKQQPGGGFVLSTYAVSGLGVNSGTPDWSIAAGDFDANGFCDLGIGNGSRVSFVKANATGTGYTFTVDPENIFSQRTNFIDIDNDGNLDFFACDDVDLSHSYRNDGNGNLLLDWTLMPSFPLAGNYATVWIDYDNDGDQDMFMAKCRGGAPITDPQRINVLYRNNGNGTFTEVGAAAGVNDAKQSWSSAWADFDNDGDFDFVLSNVSSPEGNDHSRFYKNNGNGTFTDIFASTGIADEVGSWEIMHGDFNNDGWEDFIWQNETPTGKMYINNGNMTFTGQATPASDVAVADLNNDGFLDMFRSSTIWYNNANANKWIKLHLQGVESNRQGIGARVEIYGAWGKQIREVRSGEGFSNMSSLNVHFGIGSATSITKVIIRWPSGIVDEILDPSTNAALFVLEGSSPLAVVNPSVKAFSVSPNPVKDVMNFTFTNQTDITSANVFDLSGRIVLSSTAQNQQIDMQKLTTGTYILQLMDAQGKFYSQKFIKE